MRFIRAISVVCGVTALMILGWVAVFALIPESPDSWLWLLSILSVSISTGLTTARVVRLLGRRPKEPATNGQYVVPFTLPPSPMLIGRDTELKAVVGRLKAALHAGARIVVIHGPPGIGKTALAVSAARLAATEFADGALFASMHGNLLGEHYRETVTEAVLGGFVDSLLGPGERVPGGRVPIGLGARKQLYDDITQRVRTNVLVVLDDVPNVEAVLPLLPLGARSVVLVTSRDKLEFPATTDSYGVWTLPRLEPLGRESSFSLLKMIVGEERIEKEAAAAHEIADSALGSPLAVQLAAASLATRPNWSLTVTVESMRLLASPEPVAGAQFAPALDLSFALLTQEERQALLLFGLLKTRTFEPWELAALLGSDDEKEAWSLCDRLVHARLLEHIMDDATGVAAYRVLEHVLEYARLRMRSDLSNEVERAALRSLDERRLARRNVEDLTDILRERVYPYLERGELTRALNNARGALAKARDSHEQATEKLRVAPSTLASINLHEAREGEGRALAAVAEVLVELGGVDDAMELATLALATKSESATPRAYRCIGKLKRRQRHLEEAKTMLQRALDTARMSDNRSEQARIHRELAVVFAYTGETQEGLAAVENALSIGLSPDSSKRLRSSVLLAKATVLLVQARRTGAEATLDEAFQTLRDADEAAEAVAELQRLWTAWISHLRAQVICESGRFDVGRAVAFDALDEFAQMRHRYGAARCRLVLGRSYLEQQRPDDALPMLEEARQTLAFCGDRWIEAETAMELAAAQFLLGLRVEARHELMLAFAYYRDLGYHAGMDKAQQMLDRLAPDTTPRRRIPHPSQPGGFWTPQPAAGGRP